MFMFFHIRKRIVSNVWAPARVKWVSDYRRQFIYMWVEYAYTRISTYPTYMEINLRITIHIQVI